MSESDESRPGARRASHSMRLSRSERRRQRRVAERGGRRALRGADASAARSEARRVGRSRIAEQPRGGRRALRPRQRRTHGLSGTLGMTFLAAVVPGTGYLYAGRKALGWLLIAGWLCVAGAAGWYFGRDWRRALDIAFDPTALKITAGVLAGLLLIWLAVVWTSYRLVRPRRRPRWHTVVGNIAVVGICFVVAAPVLRAAQYALATADAVTTVLDGNDTATTPDLDEEDPWAGRDRVSILLLGGDGDAGRDGVRTDSIILLSIDPSTGRSVTFSLPRNLAGARFPEGSPLAEVYPYGFTTGDPTSGDSMINAIYRNVPAAHPGILGRSANEGADAIKQAVEGTLGIPVDYYVLVNLSGFREVVDAMGGVSVNINEPIAIGGDTSAGIPPDDYLAPGPDQHLNGFEALWFSRGRWRSDDYERMERQRCMIDAIIESADPASLLLRYLDLLKAGQEVVLTDIPARLGTDFAELALRVKDAKVRSVVFRTSEGFNSAAPDFDYLHETVQRAIAPAKRSGGGGGNAAEDPVDACAYAPTGETVEEAIAADGGY